MTFKTLLYFSLIPLFTMCSAAAAAPEVPPGNLSVYDLLPKFGLPPGLLPDTVKSFSISSDGSFTVELGSPCYVQFDYLVYYESTITGKIQIGGIQDLKGIQVKRFLLWFDVEAIKVDLPPSAYIYFYVGWITKKLDVDQFRTVHSCQKSGASSLLKSTRSMLKLPEPVREIGMLLTE